MLRSLAQILGGKHILYYCMSYRTINEHEHYSTVLVHSHCMSKPTACNMNNP